jgi:hypothetical protein
VIFFTLLTHAVNVVRIMTATGLPFRTPSELAEQTKTLAATMSATRSDHVLEAKCKKIARTMADCMNFFTAQLSVRHLKGNLALGAITADGLK